MPQVPAPDHRATAPATAVTSRLAVETRCCRAMSRIATWQWLRTLAVVGILALMIWKPGA